MIRLLLVCLLTCLAAGPAARANSLAQLRTPLGDIELELFDQDKPGTVANFKRYIEAGLWKDMYAHRLIPNFVIQAGGFAVVDRNTSPGNALVTTFPNITNEFNVGTLRSNVFGTIAMAKQSLFTNQVTVPAVTNIVDGVTNVTPSYITNMVSGGPDSANSQWFINLKDNSSNLDSQNGGFTVFGQVVAGTNVLGLFNTFTHNSAAVTNRLYNTGSAAFTDLPSLRGGLTTTAQLFSNLVYIDVTLLEVRVTNTPAGREISWKSFSGGTNVVEYTTVFPPVWQKLQELPHPTADRSAVVDPVADPRRFYRVRVAY